MKSGMSNSLASIFAQDERMNAEDRKLKAAKLRAESKAKKAQMAGLVGTGIGAVALTNPVTAPFAGLTMTAGKALGEKLVGGDAGAGDVQQALSALPREPESYTALAKLLKSFKG